MRIVDAEPKENTENVNEEDDAGNEEKYCDNEEDRVESRIRWTRPDFSVKRGSVKKRMSMVASWQEGIVYQINNFVYQHRLEIASLFRDFDRDNR